MMDVSLGVENEGTQPTDMRGFNGEPSVELGSRFRSFADRLGICLSGLCVVHCLLTPVVLLLIPTLEASVYHEAFHHGLLLVLPLLAIFAFIPGYRRHRDKMVFVWSLPGLAAIALGALVFEEPVALQIVFSVAGSLLLIRAHLLNRKQCACCETGHGRRRAIDPRAAEPVRLIKPALGRARLLSQPPPTGGRAKAPVSSLLP